MTRHVTSLSAAADMPSSYGLPEGASIIKDGTMWIVRGGSWTVAGSGIDNAYDAGKSYAEGQCAFVAGSLWVANLSTTPGPFDRGYWTEVSTLFDVKGVWDTSDPDDLPYAYAGYVYQFEGKLWRAITPDYSTNKDPSTTATEPALSAYVQVSVYGGSATVFEGDYLAIELIVDDPTLNSEAKIHRATGFDLWRTSPAGDDWEPTDVYRLVKKTDWDAAQAAHDSLLDIPTVTDLTLAYADNLGGDRQARFTFDAPIDLAPKTNPESGEYDSSAKDRYVFITDRMDVANFLVDASAAHAGLDFGWLMTYDSTDSSAPVSSTGAWPVLNITTEVPAWQLVFDPTL